MNLATDKFLQPVTENSVLENNTETGWQEVSRGLKLVKQGYLVLIVTAIVGPYLLWSATSDSASAWALSLRRQDRESILFLGVLVVGVGGLLSYGLVLAGEWRCLMHAPHRQGVKELMLVCINCVLVESLLSLAGVFVSGPQTYALLQEGSEGLAKFNYFSVGNLLVLGSVLLGLLGMAVFGQFLRNVADCFRERKVIRHVDVNLTIMGLLFGGSLGLVLCSGGLLSLPTVLTWLVGAWLTCFGWQAWLFGRVGKSIDTGLREVSAARPAPPPTGAGQVAMHTLSGLRRLIKLTP
jgi:hypothetical protein